MPIGRIIEGGSGLILTRLGQLSIYGSNFHDQLAGVGLLILGPLFLADAVGVFDLVNFYNRKKNMKDYPLENNASYIVKK